jgi:hypothetical protein
MVALPATMALKDIILSAKIAKQPQAPHVVLPATSALEDALMALNTSPLKRNRNCAFDIQEVSQESAAAEPSLDFPTIEWQFTDDNLSSKIEFSGSTDVENSMGNLLYDTKFWMRTGFGERRINRLVRCRPFLSHLSLQAN